jgi:DNA-binding MarR family transcriptional regulator
MRVIEVPNNEEEALLRIIADNRLIYAAEAAEMTGMTNRRASPVISRLKKKGLIETAGTFTTRETGKRAVQLRITKDGQEALAIIDSGRAYKVVRAFKWKEDK